MSDRSRVTSEKILPLELDPNLHIPGEHWSDPSKIRSGSMGLAALVLALTVRFWFVVSGRSPVDGDETIMAVMAYHLGNLEHIPLHFYGQHYLGTLEIPLLALVQKLGPEWWTFSVWPIRITQAVYFSFFFVVHYKLVSRFFGVSAARWSLLFLALGPAYWIEYSMRMRHVVLMMAIGELLTLVLLSIIDHWKQSRIVHWRSVFFLGFLAGLGWWHYQLIVIYLVPCLIVAIASSSILPDLLRRPQKSSDQPALSTSVRPARFSLMSALHLVMTALPFLIIAAISMGNFEAYWEYFSFVVGAVLVWASVLCALGIGRYRRDRAERVAAADPIAPPSESSILLLPTLLSVGLFAGAFPLLVYLSSLNEEFWIVKASVDPTNFFDNLRSVLLLEVAALFELTQLLDKTFDSDMSLQATTPRIYVTLSLMALSLYVLARKLVRPLNLNERLGALYYLILGMTLILLRTLFYRHVPWHEPRFLIPLVPLITSLWGPLFAEFTKRLRPRLARGAVVVAIILGAAILWGPTWREARAYDIDIRTGHRRTVLDIAETLADHEVRRIYVEYSPITSLGGWVPFGLEIMWASQMEVRSNWGSVHDRLWGLIDESLYSHEMYYLYLLETDFRNPVSFPLGLLDAPDFEVVGYGVIPLPQQYNPPGGWRGELKDVKPFENW